MVFVDYFSNKLDNNVYKEELYKIKVATKELAFASRLFKGKEVIQLYSEINEHYCMLSSAMRVTSLSRVLSFAMKNPKWYSVVYLYYILIAKISFVFRRFKKRLLK